MKKNLLTILILALLIVNLVLTGIIMFSTISANKKTVALVNNIATVLNLEIGPVAGSEEEAAVEEVSMADTEMYDIADQMTIALKKGADGKDHYALVEVSLSMNKKDKDFKDYSAMMPTKESLIKSEIIDVISSYTKEEVEADKKGMEEAILTHIQDMFDSQFVYDVAFRNINLQ